MADELLTDVGLADMFKVSRSTVRSWQSRGQIPKEVVFKLPGTKKGTIRYIKSKVCNWINGTLEKGA